MGKAETASRDKSNQARPQVRAALALRIAVKRLGRTSSSFVALLAIFLGMAACGRLIPVFAQEKSCGVERWDVKTLNDPQGAQALAAAPVAAKVGDLVKMVSQARATLLHAEAKRFPQELHQFKVRALVVGFKKEADSDFHIVLADRDNPKITMIAEIPAAICMPVKYREQFAALQAKFATDFGKPTAKFKRLAHPVAVTATGIFFLDFIHGQTGVAKNGAELHPLLSWEATSSAQ
jgi:hypothetical protein